MSLINTFYGPQAVLRFRTSIIQQSNDLTSSLRGEWKFDGIEKWDELMQAKDHTASPSEME